MRARMRVAPLGSACHERIICFLFWYLWHHLFFVLASYCFCSGIFASGCMSVHLRHQAVSVCTCGLLGLPVHLRVINV